MTTLPRRITDLPCWKGAPKGTPISGGLSNEIWKITDNAGNHVLRFCADYPFHHVCRDRELAASRAAHAAGFAPRVEFAAKGVMVTEFIDARTLTAADFQADPAMVAALLRRFHTEMPGFAQGSVGFFWPFHVIRDYARQLRDLQSPWAGQNDHYLALNAALESAQIPMPIIYGHHDTLPANLLQAPDKLWLIDYEYAGFGTAMFDLANTASIARLDNEQAFTMLSAYLGHAPDAAFLRAFEAMRCTSLLREAMWSMVSQHHLTTPGVDFAAYATENLEALGELITGYETRHGKLVP